MKDVILYSTSVDLATLQVDKSPVEATTEASVVLARVPDTWEVPEGISVLSSVDVPACPFAALTPEAAVLLRQAYPETVELPEGGTSTNQLKFAVFAN